MVYQYFVTVSGLECSKFLINNFHLRVYNDVNYASQSSFCSLDHQGLKGLGLRWKNREFSTVLVSFLYFKMVQFLHQSRDSYLRNRFVFHMTRVRSDMPTYSFSSWILMDNPNAISFKKNLYFKNHWEKYLQIRNRLIRQTLEQV